MSRVDRTEDGQAVVEMAFILGTLLVLIVGLIDVGRGFFQYNSLSNAARFGARWASVVGGTCDLQASPVISTSDWCNGFASPSAQHLSTNFWNTSGNHPLQTDGSDCPNSYNSGNAADWYSASSFSLNGKATTIVQAVMQHIDSDANRTTFVTGSIMPGFDLSKAKVCLYLPGSDYSSGTWQTYAGDTVAVYIYYPFQPVGPILGNSVINLVASSRYIVECCTKVQ